MKIGRISAAARLAGAALASTFILASAAPAQVSNCSTQGQTVFVSQRMLDVYYWYREMPDVHPLTFDSPEAYLNAVVYRPLDRGFTYIVPRAQNQALVSESQFVGVGITRLILGNDEYRVAQVYPGGPAHDAGLVRGDRVLEINGRTIADLLATGDLAAATGPETAGVKVNLKVQSLDGRERMVELVKRTVTIPTVSDVTVIERDRRRVGYIHFRNFVEPSVAALDAAFTQLETAAITDLVLDVRYNGGGLVSVAQHLAGLIGGGRTEGQVLGTYAYNDKNTRRNASFRFLNPPHALTLPRLVVITSRASASASEFIVNGLRPYIPVTTVGETTFGKPVGQAPVEFCDKVLYPAAFVVKNAAGAADYFDGIRADCPAPDDVTHPLGSADEASLAEALYFLENGRCRETSGQTQALARRAPRPAESGWRLVLNAD